jgi:hypothetical protein
VDVRQLSPGEQLIGVSGVALFVVSFLDWVGARITTLTIQGRSQSLPSSAYRFSDNAWAHPATFLAVLIGVLMLGYVALRLVGLEPPRSAVTARILAGLGLLALVLVIGQLLAGPHVDLAAFGLPSSANLGGVHISFVKTRSPGAYAGLVATAGLAGGGYLVLRGR